MLKARPVNLASLYKITICGNRRLSLRKTLFVRITRSLSPSYDMFMYFEILCGRSNAEHEFYWLYRILWRHIPMKWPLFLLFIDSDVPIFYEIAYTGDLYGVYWFI